MKIFLTGATGLLGGDLVETLSAEGFETRSLVRRGSPNAARLEPGRTEIFYGDARDGDALARGLDGLDVFLHVAGLEYTPQVLSAARKAGVERLLVIGSTSVHSAYEHRSGWRLGMEELVRESGLDWTIIRPTMIYGSELDKNMHKLLRFLSYSPVFPMFGPGTNLWQPVYYKDLTCGVLAALQKPETIRQSYDLPGAEPLSYREIVRVAAEALGRDPYVVPLPLEPVRRSLRLAERARLPLPVESEQVMRLREDKAYSYEKARRELDYAPRSFQKGIALEAERLWKIGLVST